MWLLPFTNKLLTIKIYKGQRFTSGYQLAAHIAKCYNFLSLMNDFGIPRN